MIILVTGGSGSGKSEYGESLILSLNHPFKYYVATMEVYGAEGREKVKRHRRLRKDKGFITLECSRDLGKLRLDRGGAAAEPDAGDKMEVELEAGNNRVGEPDAGICTGPGIETGSYFKEGKSVLLECVSNLAANEMFREASPGEGWPRGEGIAVLAAALGEDIIALSAQAEDMVIITNEVGNDGISYEQETMDYICLMGLLNRHLAVRADRVVEVVYGIPVVWKNSGEGHRPSEGVI